VQRTRFTNQMTWQNWLSGSSAAVLEDSDGTVYGEVVRHRARGPRSWTWYVPPSPAGRARGEQPRSGYAPSKAAAQRACEASLVLRAAA
jgi:hypothetical protein